MESEGPRRVLLTGVPTTLYIQLHVHVDNLLRELALLGVSEEYGLPSGWDDARTEAEAAERTGHDHIDVELWLPVDAADQLSGLFRQADALARTGLLLTTDLSPAVRELRDWMIEELARRLRDDAEP